MLTLFACLKLGSRLKAALTIAGFVASLHALIHFLFFSFHPFGWASKLDRLAHQSLCCALHVRSCSPGICFYFQFSEIKSCENWRDLRAALVLFNEQTFILNNWIWMCSFSSCQTCFVLFCFSTAFPTFYSIYFVWIFHFPAALSGFQWKPRAFCAICRVKQTNV